MSPLQHTCFGYARVSTGDQDLTLQREALKAAGCTIIREEKASGTTTNGRTELAQLLEFIRTGDGLAARRRLEAPGCTIIREEKASGTTTNGRTELAQLLEFIRKGDVLVVTRIDRLARSIVDMEDIVETA